MSKAVRNSLHIWCKLFLFCLLLPIGCAKNQDTSQAKVSILWKEGQATGFSIPLSLLKNVSKEEIAKLVKVQLANSGIKTAILGEYNVKKDTLVFKPLIPFTRGLHYEVAVNGHLISTIEIPKSTNSPTLLGIYPTQDILPENLLKFYFVFAQPMVEGHSLDYIKLLSAKGDTLSHTFLNLQPELWNAERTVLTLWLDPGRIKRDLQPNKRLGNPLTKGSRYKLIVFKEWSDAQGAILTQNYTKDFVVAERDMLSPKTDDWSLRIPKKGTIQPLEIDLKEALDYILLQNAIQIVDDKGNKIEGLIKVNAKEQSLHFIPTAPWLIGRYKLQIEARLEDLAGNNLNRLFDRDVTNHQTHPSEQKFFERQWQVE